MRILQIGMTDNLGGIETFLINYYRNIDKTKIQFDFVNIYKEKLYFQEEIENMGGKVYKLTSYYKNPIKYIKELKKLINQNKYEIVHCNMNSAAMIYPLIAGKISNAKVIIAHSHNSSSDKGLLKSVLHNINKHFIPLFANTFFACSNEAGKWFFNKNILNSDKFKVIYNAIDTEKFIYNEQIRHKKQKELKLDKNKIIIGHVGRFEKQKNHEFLIDIFNEILKINPNVMLLLIGEGSLKQHIKEKVTKLDLEDKVIFLGKRNDVNELYQVMDVFVFPSLYEGLGTVLIEAQYSGLPCVVSNNIPKEAQITRRFEYLELKKINEWKNTIFGFINNSISEREKNTFLENYRKFDIKIATENLEKKYIKLLEK